MENVIVDFTVTPAKAKCLKCGKEIELPPQKKLSDTLKLIEDIKDLHKACN